jgi:hypothetical protein
VPSVVVETWTMARKRRLLDRWSVPIEPGPAAGGGAMTLRDLITRVVHREVAAFERRQTARQFVRVLSEREIAVRAVGGRVDPGGRPAGHGVQVDDAVAAVLTAFEDGLFIALLDGVEQRDLDATVHVTDDSRLVFVRLTLLAGA